MLLRPGRNAALGLTLLAGCASHRPAPAAPAPVALNERVTLSGVLAPNQVIKVGMTQDIVMDMEFEGGPMGPMHLTGRTSFSATQRSSAPDAQGHLSVELTVDELTINMDMNGQALPNGAGADPLTGKTLTIVYDAEGKVLDVTSASIPEPTIGMMRGMMQSFGGNIPRGALALGDSVIVPLSMALPLAMPGGASGSPLNMEIKTTSRLVAIDRDGPDRIATLDQNIVSTTTQAAEAASPGSAVAGDQGMRMTGTGRMQVNVEKGFVKADVTDTKIEGKLPIMGMTVKLTGTTHLVLTGSAQPK